MTYEQCIRLAFFDPFAWGLVLVAVVAVLMLLGASRPKLAAILIGVTILSASFSARIFYEVNCSELRILES